MTDNESRTFENKALYFSAVAVLLALCPLLLSWLGPKIYLKVEFLSLAVILFVALSPIVGLVFAFFGRRYGMAFLKKENKGSLRIHLSRAMGTLIVLVYLFYCMILFDILRFLLGDWSKPGILPYGWSPFSLLTPISL